MADKLEDLISRMQSVTSAHLSDSVGNTSNNSLSTIQRNLRRSNQWGGSDDDDNVITITNVSNSLAARYQQVRSVPHETCELSAGRFTWPKYSDLADLFAAFSASSRVPRPKPGRSMRHVNFNEAFQPCNLDRGEKVAAGLALCPFKLVQIYPYRFVGIDRNGKVSNLALGC
jgi:hypothetical protein